jgi:hypothetical protein
LKVIGQPDIALFGMWDALEEVDVFHRFRPRCLFNEAEENLANKIRKYLEDGCCGWAELFDSPPSLRFRGQVGGQVGAHVVQPSPKLRLASRSIGEGWWRWRESNPRPKNFSK